MNSNRDPVTRGEATLLGSALVVALVIHLLLLDPLFNGPDATSNFIFATSGQDWAYWLDPQAFLQYLFPMGYGSFLALVTRFSGGSFLPVQLIQIAI